MLSYLEIPSSWHKFHHLVVSILSFAAPCGKTKLLKPLFLVPGRRAIALFGDLHILNISQPSQPLYHQIKVLAKTPTQIITKMPNFHQNQKTFTKIKKLPPKLSPKRQTSTKTFESFDSSLHNKMYKYHNGASHVRHVTDAFPPPAIHPLSTDAFHPLHSYLSFGSVCLQPLEGDIRYQYAMSHWILCLLKYVVVSLIAWIHEASQYALKSQIEIGSAAFLWPTSFPPMPWRQSWVWHSQRCCLDFTIQTHHTFSVRCLCQF